MRASWALRHFQRARSRKRIRSTHGEENDDNKST